MPWKENTKEQIMNFIIALRQRSFFIKKTLEMAGAAALIIAALFLAGCNTGVGYDLDETAASRSILSILDNPVIDGTWRYEYDYVYNNVRYAGHEEYEITATTLSYTFWDDVAEDDYGMSFSGDIVSVVYNGTSGVIIIEYGEPPIDGTFGHFNAVYFNNLTETTVQLGNAVNLSDYSSSEIEDENVAEDIFIWDNVDNYIDWDYVNIQTKVN
jgi:predicted small secreted protein